MSEVVVIGVGNALRRDDGAGVAVAAALRGRVPDGVRVVSCEDEPTRLLDAWDGAETVVLVDAVSSGAPPGTIRRFDASSASLPSGLFRSSTHALGVGDAVELARALGRLPRTVVVYAVEAADFAAGERLSDAVGDAIDAVAERVLEEVRCTSAP